MITNAALNTAFAKHAGAVLLAHLRKVKAAANGNAAVAPNAELTEGTND